MPGHYHLFYYCMMVRVISNCRNFLQAQWAPVFSFITGDFNNDSRTDIIPAGNFYGTTLMKEDKMQVFRCFYYRKINYSFLQPILS